MRRQRIDLSVNGVRRNSASQRIDICSLGDDDPVTYHSRRSPRYRVRIACFSWYVFPRFARIQTALPLHYRISKTSRVGSLQDKGIIIIGTNNCGRRATVKGCRNSGTTGSQCNIINDKATATTSSWIGGHGYDYRCHTWRSGDSNAILLPYFIKSYRYITSVRCAKYRTVYRSYRKRYIS